ncbi:MAG: hypothetical protein RLZZ347_666 [Candidatus Parcubacteria bacterium]|jgi:formate-dependent nitrite reductase membrane component NrfD
MKDIFKRHLVFWADKSIRLNLLLSGALFSLSLFLTHWAQTYVDTYSGSPIPDLLLDHVPVMNVNLIFFQGAFLFVVLLVLVLLYEPKYIPFTIGSSALFFTVRSLFTILTHLAAPGAAMYQYVDYDHHIRQVVFTLSSGNDLFFSGHAGFPFLLALVFWNFPKARYFFLICSVVGSVVVILGHLHYSIDVFSAFFISFGIFEIAKRVFKKEFAFI